MSEPVVENLEALADHGSLRPLIENNEDFKDLDRRVEIVETQLRFMQEWLKAKHYQTVHCLI